MPYSGSAALFYRYTDEVTAHHQDRKWHIEHCLTHAAQRNTAISRGLFHFPVVRAVQSAHFPPSDLKAQSLFIKKLTGTLAISEISGAIYFDIPHISTITKSRRLFRMYPVNP